jgi:hypothetical protein
MSLRGQYHRRGLPPQYRLKSSCYVPILCLSCPCPSYGWARSIAWPFATDGLDDGLFGLVLGCPTHAIGGKPQIAIRDQIKCIRHKVLV